MAAAPAAAPTRKWRRSSGLAGLLSEESLFCPAILFAFLLSKSLDMSILLILIRAAHFFVVNHPKLPDSIPPSPARFHNK